MKAKLFFLFLVSGLIATAQSLTFTAKSGDAELDATLTDMNSTAKLDLGGFKAKISADFKLTTAKIDIMLGTMTPADVFMNAQVAIIIGKPVDDVIVVFNKNKGKGWGVIAKELGIKPGSKEFHQLKDSTKVKNREMKNKVKPAPKTGAVEAGKSKGKGKGKK
jgi:hypothetical protein